MADLFASSQPELVALGRVVLAILLGAVIGVERELAEKPAGLRTHMLVAGAAALFVGLGSFLVEHFGATGDGAGLLRLDPIRLMEALVTGIAFLGAGTIIRDRGTASVRGLTTAASLLFTGVVGVSVAVGQYLLAVGSTLILVATLRLIGAIERRLL